MYMKILLGSKSDKKYNALVKALEIVNINDYDIECYKVDSLVSDNPINEETLLGAKNRNNNLKELNSNYDMLVSIEAGFTKEDNNYYVDTYCVVNYKDIDYVGMSSRLRITDKVFNYVKEGNVLHLLVQKLQGSHTDDGVVGYLSNGKLKRTEVEVEAVVRALEKALNINSNYKSLNIDSYLDNESIKKLDEAIEKECK